MKVYILADATGPEIHSAHAKREEAEAAAKAKIGDGGSWSTAHDQRTYDRAGKSVRMVERPVEGNPLGD